MTEAERTDLVLAACVAIDARDPSAIGRVLERLDPLVASGDAFVRAAYRNAADAYRELVSTQPRPHRA